MKFAALLLLAFFKATHGQGILCITTHCFLQVGSCVLDSQCYEILNCLQGCAGTDDEAGCSFACGMLDGNENFRNLLNCMVENDCIMKVIPILNIGCYW